VIIDDLDLMRIAINPGEADSVFVINPDAMLALAIAAQPFKTIPRWNHKVFKRQGRVQDVEFFECLPIQIWRQRPAFPGLP
jgi:hypothetical protein